MPKPATFIALPMSINLRKWYIAYLNMLTNFKIVILSVTLPQSVTIPKPLKFRWLRQKVTLCVYLYSRCKDEKFLILIALWTKIYQFFISFFLKDSSYFRSPNPLPRGLRPSPQPLSPLQGRGSTENRRNRDLSEFWYGSQSLCPSGASHVIFIGWRGEKTFIIYYHAKTLGYGVKPQIA